MLLERDAVVTAVSNEPEAPVADITLYPNPSDQGTLNITVPDDLNASFYTVNLLDMQGQSVFSKRFDHKDIRISTNGLNAGLYIVLVQGGDQLFKKTVIIEH